MRYSFGDYVLDTERQELRHAGAPVRIRRKVFQVLAYLLAHRARVVPKQELLGQLWPDPFVGDEALTSCVRTLRQVLGERGRTPRFLRTVHGQGYHFVATVAVQEALAVDDAPPALPRYAGKEATGQAEAPSPLLLPPHTDLGSTPVEALVGEYKQVTVLSGALAEVLALAVRLGPEAMHHLMRDVLALAQEAVQRYEGTLLQVSDEGFLALFGAPIAQEDHARRAVLAALDLRQRWHAFAVLRGEPASVALRLGLHSGPVVMGPLADAPQRPYAAGATLHVAARLQQQAAPATILVSATTYALVQDEVQGERGDPLALEALSPPVPVYTIRDLKRRRAGVLRRGALPLSRFVGRTQELALLHARLAQAVHGQGQVLGIMGEPGLGKSRLLAEFARGLEGQAVTYSEGHCLAYSSATPYLPVCDLLRQLWDLPASTPAAALTATVRQRLHEAGVASEAETLLLLQLLDVPVDVAPLAVLSPQECKARTFALLRHLCRYACQQQPLVLAVENLHWSDPTSEEWLASLVEQLGNTPVLLLATYRPGYQPSWSGHAAATQIALPRLSLNESLAMLQAMPHAAQLSVPVHQAIVAKAAGNPLFVEELTWAAVAHGDHTLNLPMSDTIEAVLAARLDRLPSEEKRLVQIAAVIGTEVPAPLLQQIAGLPEDALQRGLVHLQSMEFLYETHLFPEHTYTFKHALIREVGYGSLLHEQRHALHAQIVDAMEMLYAERLREHIERLAHHALQGEVWDKALGYYREAGATAAARSAYREAVACLEQALGALQHLPASRDIIEQAIDLRFDLAEVLVPLEQYEQGLTHLRAAETLAEGLADQRRLGCIYRSRANTLRNLQDYEPALTYFQRAHAMATALGDAALQGWVNQEMGMTYFNLGDYRQAMAYLQQVLTALEGELCDQSFGVVGLPSVRARIHMVLCLSELGNFADGVAYGNEALQVAEAVNGLWERQAVYTRLGHLHVRQGNLRQAIVLLEQVAVWGQDATIPLFYRISATLLALAYALTGRTTDAVTMLEQVMRNADSPFNAVTCGEAYLLAGDVEEAYRLAQRALANTHHRKARGEEARTLWLFGEIAMRRDPPDVVSAATFYQQARTLAKELGMRPLQAHCHRGLGALYAQTGRRAQARAALGSAIALYRVMNMIFWLPQAEAALAQVE